MTRQGKVYVVPKEHMLLLLTGGGRMRLPFDAKILGFTPVEPEQGATQDLGVLVHSDTFPITPVGEPLPRVSATLERLG